MPTPKSRRSSSAQAFVGDQIHDVADVVDAQAVLRDRTAEAAAGPAPSVRTALEMGRQVFLRVGRRLGLVLDQVSPITPFGDYGDDTGPTSAG